MSKRLLSLFSGCGGMELGFEGHFWIHQDCINLDIHPDWAIKKKEDWVLLSRNSFQTVFANDVEKSAYHAWLPYFTQRGSDPVFHLNSLVNLVKLAETNHFDFPSQIDIVTGGFPCQDFSVSGKRKGCFSHKSHTGSYLEDGEDKIQENRGVLYQWMIKVIERTHPKIFVAENVKGLTSLEVSEKIFEDFKTMNNQSYYVIPRVLYAPDFGIPQKRERLFLIGVNKHYLNAHALKVMEQENRDHLSLKESLNLAFKHKDYDLFPSPTHSLSDALLKKYSTVKAILSGLNEPEDERSDLSQMSYSQAKFLSKGQGQIEIDLNGLSPTIRAEHHGNIEYRRLSQALGGNYLDELEKGHIMRRLTVRECARIQTFPDDFEFVKSRKSDYPLSASQGYKLIGNAVPPLLAYHLAKRLELIWNHLF
jgi:DNA (cytosine-5)-methyltransferase 1